MRAQGKRCGAMRMGRERELRARGKSRAYTPAQARPIAAARQLREEEREERGKEKRAAPSSHSRFFRSADSSPLLLLRASTAYDLR